MNLRQGTKSAPRSGTRVSSTVYGVGYVWEISSDGSRIGVVFESSLRSNKRVHISTDDWYSLVDGKFINDDNTDVLEIMEK